MERFAEYDAGLIPYISKKVRDPSWRSKLAIATRKLADGDIAWLEKNLPSADIRIALVMAGRNQEILEQETERRIPEIEIRQGIAQ
jgi:hypothetical protein